MTKLYIQVLEGESGFGKMLQFETSETLDKVLLLSMDTILHNVEHALNEINFKTREDN